MKYRKKPVEIEAIQWTGTNPNEIINFIENKGYYSQSQLDKDGHYNFAIDLKIYTLEGIMNATIGDYIIKGIDGEFYPCKSDIFEKTYEKVEEEENV